MVQREQSWEWTNVFHFTADGENGKYGDRIPAVFIHKNKYFQFCSAINGEKNYCRKHDFEPFKMYSIVLRQYEKKKETYEYQIIVDNVIIHEVVNNQPINFPNVKLYASNPWQLVGFDSTMGKACWFNIVGGDP